MDLSYLLDKDMKRLYKNVSMAAVLAGIGYFLISSCHHEEPRIIQDDIHIAKNVLQEDYVK